MSGRNSGEEMSGRKCLGGISGVNFRIMIKCYPQRCSRQHRPSKDVWNFSLIYEIKGVN